MGFSGEWEEMYKTGMQNSIWPWSDVVSLTNRYFKGDKSGLRVLELGCGAGANIPFFEQSGFQYFGIEGSETEVGKISKRFTSKRVVVKCADFTKEIPFNGQFDLILDRSSVTHNSSEDIQKVIELIYEKLKVDGLYFGIDWFSTNYGHYNTDDDEFEEIDANTRVFHTGKFKGLGNVHFSDPEHIRELFFGMKILEMYEKVDKWEIPEERYSSHWNFIAGK